MNKPVEFNPAQPTYAVAAPAVRSLPIQGSIERFPINRIFCVGRNYAEHAREMGHNPDREPPFFFMKPSSTLVSDGETFPYPALSTDVHHEIAGRRLADRRQRHPCCNRLATRVRLRSGARHDAARPAKPGQKARPPLGHGKGL